VRVAGSAPRLFPLSLLLPDVTTSASLPLERYPQAEAGRRRQRAEAGQGWCRRCCCSPASCSRCSSWCRCSRGSSKAVWWPSKRPATRYGLQSRRRTRAPHKPPPKAHSHAPRCRRGSRYALNSTAPSLAAASSPPASTNNVALASLPFIGGVGVIELGGHASAPIDRNRSLLTGDSPLDASPAVSARSKAPCSSPVLLALALLLEAAHTAPTLFRGEPLAGAYYAWSRANSRTARHFRWAPRAARSSPTRPGRPASGSRCGRARHPVRHVKRVPMEARNGGRTRAGPP
jgi:hypothetical protein